MRDSLYRFEHKGLDYEHALYLREGSPAWLSMNVYSKNRTDELENGDEIKCSIDLYPVSRKFMLNIHAIIY